MATAYRDAPSDLGALVSVHRSRGNGCLVFCAGGVIAAFGALMIGMGLPVWQGGAYILLAIVGGYLAFRWIERKGAFMVELHEHGLVERAGAKVTSMRFDEVTSVTRDVRQTYRYRLPNVRTESHVVQARDGRVVRFTLMNDRAPALLAAVVERVMPRIRAEALRAIDAGETVKLGPFALSEEGIGVAGEPVVPWIEIGRAVLVAASLRSGGIEMLRVELRSGEPWTQQGVSTVPNAELLVEIVDLAVEDARATSAR